MASTRLSEILEQLKECLQLGHLNEDEHQVAKDKALSMFFQASIESQTAFPLPSSKPASQAEPSQFETQPQTQLEISPIHSSTPVEHNHFIFDDVDTTLPQRLLFTNENLEEEIKEEKTETKRIEKSLSDGYDHEFEERIASFKVSNKQEFCMLLKQNTTELGTTVQSPNASICQKNQVDLNASFSEHKQELSIDTSAADEKNLTTAAVFVLPSDNNSEEKEKKDVINSISDLTVAQFWSIILQTPIPEGKYYPLPSDMVEPVRKPFILPKPLIDSLIDPEATNGFKSGASVVLRAYHPKTFGGLQLPWCILKMFRTTSIRYEKAESITITFYCPWHGCKVQKKWFCIKRLFL